MDIRFLETFITIADCGSIAQAARRLNRTPAALAQRLRALEQELGHRLVLRSGRTVQPTAEGQAILDHARVLVQGARDLQALAANGVPAGQLRLGATATSLTGLLPGVITRLAADHPSIEYFVQPGSSVDLYHRVVAGQLDAAIIVKPQFSIPKSTDWLTIRDEPLVFIASKSAPDLDPHSLIAQSRFIRYDRNQWGGQIVDRYIRDHGLAVQEWLELDALDAIAAMVDRGLGVAIVPDWAPPWPAEIKLRKQVLLGGEARQTGVIWQRSGARHPAVSAFVRACQTVFGLAP
ncbi:DNA-binding transcriptional regulator, LysR family [Paracoccus halophilus]|uniref:DNA-binding transcriptional regulator, LysR family n=1 Tax=Paracoccus halophilus TaxID=376733 RepID=A0A099EWQ3_9RHOB|nr:LysR family transcriptional regulator [Paracoccus halophilus]KGJ02644.1 LysR family transcriptional regulator [Paracoccus halophilus]SFA60533.1 DNA-binding transcriptional regulator, LysR family [Paracoccus halophilus]